MAFSGAKRHDLPNGRPPEAHIVAFAGAATTATITSQLTRVKGVSITPLGAPAATEAQLSLSGFTVSDFGDIPVPAGGGLTVTRPAGTTANLIVSVLLWGI